MSDGNIAALAEALAKAQGAFTSIAKGKTAHVKSDKGNYDYKYSTLDDLIAATRPALSANGLACIQHARTDAGRVAVVTELLHASGQRLAFPEVSLPSGSKPQEVGSAMTYARRYSLSAALNVASEDDDGGRVAQDAAPRQQRAPREQQQRPRPAQDQATASSAAPGVISDAQRTRLWTIAKEVGWTKPDVEKLLALYQFDSSRRITVDKYDEIITAIETGSVPETAQEGAADAHP